MTRTAAELLQEAKDVLRQANAMGVDQAWHLRATATARRIDDHLAALSREPGVEAELAAVRAELERRGK